MERILVPVDGSPLSLAAVENASAAWPEAELVVLHVIDPIEPGYSTPTDVDVAREPLHGSAEWFERARELGDEILETAAAIATEAGHEVTTIQTQGRPDREILDVAEREAVDLIVIGSHGREADSEIPIGSVADLVVRRSPVPVTVVR